MERSWSLVVHEVTQGSANIWVGTLSSSLAKPDEWRLRYWIGTPKDPKFEKTTKTYKRTDWKRPFSNINKRFYNLVTLTELSPGKHYTVQFQRKVDKEWQKEIADFEKLPGKKWEVSTEEKEPWVTLAVGQFDTLPTRLPKDGAGLFTVGIGSCYYNSYDGNSVSDAYTALYDSEKHWQEQRPHVKFLVGDQVYLDIGLDSLSTKRDDIRHRIADDYKSSWQGLSGLLSRGGTWMLPDDHEFWNNYPFFAGTWNPYLFKIRTNTHVRNTWTRAAKDGIKNVQRCPIVSTFGLGQDLSFCFADLRTYRTEEHLLPPKDFNKLLDWAKGLSCPGVLALPQPLLDKSGGDEDWNLLNYPSQYGDLLRGLASSGHDIVILTGDVHFGRIARTTLGENGCRLYEVISSPLSNLTWQNALATNTPKKLTKFPSIAVDDIPSAKVTYTKRNWAVSTVNKFLDLRYPWKRTREHFMTLRFSRLDGGQVRMEIDAWRVRKFNKTQGLPKKDFTAPVKIDLS